ncbi:MAG: T9SS type A sorting domain-containing protein [Bacteroidia bacterium]|nr:T9SS type A sorting domain-containing protein [Bacteroidia bacterium]MDW8347832.1 T9SS type A sorting domain-containing protein [Bacteroidia bacterium]
MIVRILIPIFILISVLDGIGQAPTTPYKWHNYATPRFSYQIQAYQDRVYMRTTRGIYVYQPSTQRGKMLTRVEGLSGVDYSAMGVQENVGVLVGSKEGYIDIIQGDEVKYRILDIQRSSFANKQINCFAQYSNLCFIGTAFGIVVYNFERYEVKETYTKLGSFSNNIPINSIAILQDTIFVSTSSGVAFASLKSTNLINPLSWLNVSLTSGLPAGEIKQIVNYHDTLYTYKKDSIFYKPTYQRQWFFLDTIPNLIRLHAQENEMLILFSQRQVMRYKNKNNKSIINYVYNPVPFASDVTYHSGDYYFSDIYLGLYRFPEDGAIYRIITNTIDAGDSKLLAWKDGKLWVGTGGYSGTGVPLYSSEGVFYFDGKQWNSFTRENVSNPFVNVYDTYRIYAPKDYDGIFFSAFFGPFVKEAGGLIEYKNNTFYHYNIVQGLGRKNVGATIDIYGNLWTASYAVVASGDSSAASEVCVRTKNNQWIKLKGLAGNNDNIFGIMSDANGYKWFILRGDPNNNSILVYDDRGTPANLNDDRFRYLNVENTGLANKNVKCIVEDLNGEIWVGTEQGISVFYNPANIFSNSTKAQCPVNNQRCLLNSEVVNCITVDGSNRKWIGTTNGLWLFSSDGTREIYYFNKDNSPLFSNNILDVVINNNTGEVYISTDLGLLSFMGDSTHAEPDQMGELFLYPNPFKPGEHEYLSLQGTVRDAEVKIMDVNGKLVKATIANGGTVVWDGKDKTGNYVNTGIYVILVSDRTGKVTGVTKFAYIRK